jgi:hypothetical protein
MVGCRLAQGQERARRERVRRINARVLGNRAPHAADYAIAIHALRVFYRPLKQD